VGLFRFVCTNGLVVSTGAFLVWRVMHRGDVIEDVVQAALQISERFELLATYVERMERTQLDRLQQLDFAAEAFAMRFPKDLPGAVEPSRFRPDHVGDDLWRTFNVLQENLLRGGIPRRSASKRLTRTRRIMVHPGGRSPELSALRAGSRHGLLEGSSEVGMLRRPLLFFRGAKGSEGDRDFWGRCGGNLC
jgi:hypothetical protein